MIEFFQLSAADRLEALEAAANASGRPPHLLEKDIWVVWALQHLYSSPFASHLVFKGGTSLSKAYGVIHRFSEDVDLTYDIREIAGDLVGHGDAPLPKSRSQSRKWTDAIRERLSIWIRDEIEPQIRQALEQAEISAATRLDSDKLYIEYVPLMQGTGYVKPAVMLEFGARSTGEPFELRPISCDAAKHLPNIAFPTVIPQVMKAERTFWEKATAIHVFCEQGAFRGGARFARHWHDLIRLDTSGFADIAIADIDLALAVAKHKGAFFPEKNTLGEAIDYEAAVTGGLKLVPCGAALAVLAADYQHMIDDGLVLEDVESFDTLIDRCLIIQQKANSDRKGTEILNN